MTAPDILADMLSRRRVGPPPRMGPLWFRMAREACEALEREGIPAAVTGSFAGYVFGCSRTPGDLDIEVPKHTKDTAWRVVLAPIFSFPPGPETPGIDIVPVPPYPCRQRVVVDGIPYIAPACIAWRKAARAAATAQGIATGRGDPGTDIPDAVELLRRRGVPPFRPRALAAVLRAALDGGDVRAALLRVPAAPLVRMGVAAVPGGITAIAPRWSGPAGRVSIADA